MSTNKYQHHFHISRDLHHAMICNICNVNVYLFLCRVGTCKAIGKSSCLLVKMPVKQRKQLLRARKRTELNKNLKLDETS